MSNFDFRTWSYLNEHLAALFREDPVEKISVRRLVYMAYLRRLLSLGKTVSNRAKVLDGLGHPPSAIVDGLLKKFTEQNRDGRPIMTPAMEIKLLSYLSVLCLMADNYCTDVTRLASDLALPSKK